MHCSHPRWARRLRRLWASTRRRCARARVRGLVPTSTWHEPAKRCCATSPRRTCLCMRAPSAASRHASRIRAAATRSRCQACMSTLITRSRSRCAWRATRAAPTSRTCGCIGTAPVLDFCDRAPRARVCIRARSELCARPTAREPTVGNSRLRRVPHPTPSCSRTAWWRSRVPARACATVAPPLPSQHRVDERRVRWRSGTRVRAAREHDAAHPGVRRVPHSAAHAAHVHAAARSGPAADPCPRGACRLA